MANQKISDLSAVTTLPDTYLVETANPTVNNFKITAANMKADFRAMTISSVSTDTVLTAWHVLVLMDASGGPKTVALPAASGADGLTVIVKKIDSSSNAVTVDGNASETVDGDSNYVLYNQNESAMFVSDGTNIQVV